MLTGKLVILVLGVIFKEITCEIKQEEGVLVLTKDNFESAITDNEFILVEFYAPWCGHCKALAPEYAKAAGILSEKHPNIKLGKVDATEETELSEQHNVKGYPSLKFFRSGKAIEYTGGRKADEIVNWLAKKTGPPAKSLTSADEVKAFKEANKVVIIGYFDDNDSEAAKNFISVAKSYDDLPFGIVSDAGLFSDLGAKDDAIVLYKKFDNEPAVYNGKNKEAELKKFIATESLPPVVEFNNETAQKIFGGEIKSHLLLFLSRKAGHFDKIIEEITPVSKEHRQDILFVAIDSDDSDHQRILEYFGMKESEVPAIRIIKLEDEMTKYKPEKSDLSAEYIKQFVQDYLDGKLKEHLLSQDLPEDWNKGPVTVLVANNFDEVVFDKEKDVLVEFYAPWCGHCKQLSPIYDKLGESFKSNDKIVIAKIDATANELEHTKITSFPTIKLYAKGENKVIDYNGERNLDGLTKFVETGGNYGNASPDENEEDEDDDVPRKDEL